MKVLMVVPNRMVKGGIASVVNGYRDNGIDGAEIIYVESYVDTSKAAKLIKAIKGYFEFRKIIRKEHIDLVHIHSSFGPSFYRKRLFINYAYKKRIPIINHIHGAEFDKFYLNASDSKKKKIRNCYLKCNHLIALSDEWKERLSLIVPNDRISVISNYCVIPDIEVDNSNNILFMGEIGRRKGCYDIPEILKEIKGCDYSMVMAGNFVEGSEELKNMVDERVSFPGWVRGKDKDTLLKNAGIFLFPSYNEGVPMAVLEAMGYGLCVVTTNVGGIPTVINNGENGFLLKPGDIEGFSECLKKLLEDKELRDEIGQRARKHVMKNYSYPVHEKLISNLYEKVASMNQNM